MAGKINKYLSKAVKYADRLSGASAKQWKAKASILSEAARTGLTPARANRLAKVHAGRSFQTRAKTGLAIASAGAGGYLGLHKYHQHKDRQIMRRIDQMYRESQRLQDLM